MLASDRARDEREKGGADHVREVHRQGAASCCQGARRSQDAQSQLHRHRAHPARPHPRGKGTGTKALESLGISLDTVRQQVQEIIGQGQHAPSGHIPFTPQAKKVLELALSESKALGHHYIGTEHILLGLIREGDGVAAQVLVKLGGDLNRVRQEVIQLLHDYQAKT